MVIQFSVSNYSSFNQIQTLNFRATKLESPDISVESNNIVRFNDDRYLKILGIYGANASGKSNLLRAMAFFREMVAHSMVAEELSQSGVNPFRQSINGLSQPSYFQIVLLLDGKRFRYGFTLERSGKIASEWLFGQATRNDTFYFKRSSSDLQINSEWFPEAEALPKENLRDNALFLTFCSSYNGLISKAIRGYISRNITVDVKIRKGSRRAILVAGPYLQTNRLLEQGQEDLILTWLKEVGLVYKGIRIPEDKTFPSSTYFIKNVYDEEGKIIGETEMDLSQDESEGTKKFYTFIGKLYRKFMEGGMYIADEIDSNFHPSLLQKIIKLFQNSDINKANAQLLFTSHDTNLMDPEIMRRDQFYFTEKTLYDATKLYSLADLKGIRNNADFARQYLAGMYGALPILGDYLEEENESQENDI